MPRVGFKDHFSGHAGSYARFRPGYPSDLYAWLAEATPARDLAWDVGTGNGQAARGLAEHFVRVVATDASAEQLRHALAPKNVTFRQALAERSGLDDATVDLVAVGQALHWFDLDSFYAEVHRVLRPRGLLAAWTYQLNVVTPAVDAEIRHFYEEVVGPWWPPERVHVERAYRDLAFPFVEREVPTFSLETQWTLDDYLDYIATWSAVRRYRLDRGDDPIPALRSRLTPSWGRPRQVRRVTWPLALRAGYRPG